MNNPSKMDLLRQAKELTGSNDVQTLIQAAEQLEQYLTFDDLKKSVDDFVEFAPHCMLQHPTRGVVPFVLQPHQIMAGYAMQFSDFVVINTARQMGITALNAAFLLWDASAHSDKNIVYMSNTYAVTSEVISRIRFMIDNAPVVDLNGYKIPLPPKLVSATKNQLRFENGSRIDTITFNNFDTAMRGRSVDTWVIDNAAYVPHKYERDLGYHLAITRSHGKGKIIVSSTPYESKGFFYNLWQNAEQYQASKVFLPYYMHAERDETWLEEMKKRLPQENIENEFLCKFIERT